MPSRPSSPELDKLQPFKRNEANRERAAILREFLNSYPSDANEKAKFDIRSKRTWYERMMENVAGIACSKTHPLSVAAYNAIMDRAYGKPKPSDEELGAMKEGRFQLVYVNQATVDPDIPIEEARALPPQPEFVNAEFMDDESNQPPKENNDAER